MKVRLQDTGKGATFGGVSSRCFAALEPQCRNINIMTRLIRTLFWVSDICAWLLALYSAFGVVAYPIAGPTHARMISEPLTLFEIIATCGLFVITAVGAFLVTRRRVVGVLLVLLLACVWIYRGHYDFALSYIGICILVFGAPFALMIMQLRIGHSKA